MTSIRILAKTADFAFSVLRAQLAADAGKNIMVSPLSLSVALGMTAIGADGSTRAGIEKTLGLPDYGDGGKTNAVSYANLISALTGEDLGVKFKIANSIWAAKRPDVRFSQAFLDTNKQYFGAEVNAENFGDPATKDKINGWVNDKTEGKIPTIIKEITPDHVMFLINAVYFKGEWAEKFDKANTFAMDFHAPAGTKQTPFMYRSADFRYARTELGQFVALPFGDVDSKRFSLFVLLPSEGRTVEDVLSGISGASFNELVAELSLTELDLFLPKFEVEYDATMNDTLIGLGMGDAFNAASADFSRLVDSAGGGLYISEVLHKVYARVDEEGAEAAAATSVGAVLECVRMTPVMQVDRPFIALIADENTGTIAFAGVINNPEAPKK